jgi:hypothetical protein
MGLTTRHLKNNLLRNVTKKSKRKRLLGRCRWMDNIKMDLKRRWGGMDWSDLAHDMDQWRALVNMVMNHRVP